MIRACLICGDSVECPEGALPLCKKRECVAKHRRLLHKKIKRQEADAKQDAEPDDTEHEEATALESGAKREPEFVVGTGTGKKAAGLLQSPFVTAVLPTHDREAPYGRDLETDRPLKPIRTHLSQFVGVPGIDITKLCRHRNKPSTCFLCVAAEKLKTIQPNPRREIAVPKPSEPAVTEESVRKALGLEPKPAVKWVGGAPPTSAPWYTTPQEKERHRLPVEPKAKPRSNGRVRYLDVLGLTQEDLLAWLELQPVLYGHPGNVTVEPKREWQRIALDYDESPLIEHQKQIQQREDELKELESNLADARDPNYDGGLNPQQRRWLKVGLEKNIKKMKNEIGGLKRKKIEPRRRSYNECWVSVEIAGTVHEVTRYPSLPTITEDDVRCYREVVNLARPYSKEWRDFENKVILNAIKGWIFAPLKSVVREHSDLTRPMYGIPQFRVNGEGLDSTFDDATHEASLITKTGGDQIGGSIISAGIDRNGRDRGLSSFGGSGFGISRRTGSGESESESGAPDYDVSDDSAE